MTDLPDLVYLITVDGEWPVSAIAVDNPGIIASVVEREVARRRESKNIWRHDQVHVWKAELCNIREVDLMPTTTVQASIRERDT